MPTQFNPSRAPTFKGMPSRPDSDARAGSFLVKVASQHDTDPTLHWLPPRAIGVAAAETPVATAEATMKETRGLESIIVKAGWSLW